MPVVPRYESQQTNQVAQAQQVQAGALDVSPVNKAVGEIADVFQKARDQADRMRVLSARTQLQKQVNDLTYGENGYARSQGINALYAGETAKKGIEQAQASILKDLNIRQREMFQPDLDSVTNSFNANLQNHVYNENRKAVTATVDDSIYTTEETMKQNFNNPNEITRNLLDIDKGVTDLEGLSGIVSPEYRAKRQSAAIVNTALNALSQPIPDFQSAKNIMDTFGDKMTVSDKNRLVETMRPMQLAAESGAEAQAIFDKYRTDPQGKARALLSITDPQKKQQVSQNLAMLDKAYDESQGMGSAKVLNTFLETGKIDADTYSRLDPDSQNKVMVAINAKRERDAAQLESRQLRAERAEEKAAKQAAKEQVYTILQKNYEDPNFLKTIPLEAYQVAFYNAGMTDIYNSLKKDSQRVKGLYDAGDAKRYAYGQVNLLTQRFAPADAAKKQKFNVGAYTVADSIMAELEAESQGKPISKSAIDKKISEGFARGNITIDGYFSDETKQGFAFEAGDNTFTPNKQKAVKPAKTIQEVPTVFSESFRNNLKRNGKIATGKTVDDAIIEEYNNRNLGANND